MNKILQTRRHIKYALGVGSVIGGTGILLHRNNYDVNSLVAVRLVRAASCVFNIAYIYKKALYQKATPDPTSEEYSNLKSKVHKEAAEQLLELCKMNKGVYIKVGQHIGALEYLLPKEYVETMKVLHSKAPMSPMKDILAVLKEDLGKDPSEIFASIEPNPMGAASLAQVHKATLHDGSTIALKVQHRNVRDNANIDIKCMEALVHVVAWVFPEFKFLWLVDETKRNIPKELNFLEEASNITKVTKMFAHFPWLKIPQIHPDLCTSRVLAMDFMEGGQINDVDYITENNINVYEVSDKLGKLYSEMIFNSGFVHSDPHPGNILVRRAQSSNSAELILLDHGLYASLTDDFRTEYAKLWLSILNKDKVAMKEHCTKLGVGDMYGLFACMVSGRSWDAIEAGIEKTKFTESEKEVFQRDVPNLIPEISDILTRVNRQVLLILKTNDLIRGIEHTLKTHARRVSLLVMSRCCIRSVYSEEYSHAHSHLKKCVLLISEKWQLFKLIDNTSSKENDATTPSSSDWWKGFLDAARNKSAEVLEFVKKDFDELSTTVKTEATNVVQQTTTVFRETLQLDKPESTASSMKKSVSTFLDQVSTVLNPSPDDEDEEAVVIHGTDVVPLTRLQAQLYALSNDPDTYLKEIEPELLPRYEAWLELLEEQGNKQLSNEKLIKMLLSHTLFWNRYLFRKAMLEDEDAKLQRKDKKEDEDEENKIEKDDFNYNVELSEEDQIKLLEDYEKEKQSKKLLKEKEAKDEKQGKKDLKKSSDPGNLNMREKKDMVIIGDTPNSTTSSTYSSKGSTEEDWDKEINMEDVEAEQFAS
ncbi:hypothetical protein M8J76_013711 [Diaphorina citri]|nr:hypothetical protein M8J76_013711 [Diaphorina citri]